MLVMFTHRSVGGYFCRDCASRYFWKWTPLTLLVGWPGYISVFAAPLTALSNTFQYGQSRLLAKPDQSTRPPVIESGDADKLHDALPLIMDHLNNRSGAIHRTAAELAPQIGVRPAQIIAFLRNLARAGQPSPSPVRQRGFDVVPPTQIGVATDRTQVSG